jgi:hypothetical protein
MAVSKRTRYEVLRRDNHTCRYCRATDAPLTVDHVTPVALGGTDAPDNLVACCRDCNAGKSSAAPDSSLVADVREDALRHAELVRQAYAVLVQRMGDRDEYVEEVRISLRNPVPDDWARTIGRWFEMGVPVELVVEAAQIAYSKVGLAASGRFSYMCGIVWNQVRAVDEAAEAKRAVEGSFMTAEDMEAESMYAWQRGCEAGERRERERAAREDPVRLVIDRVA